MVISDLGTIKLFDEIFATDMLFSSDVGGKELTPGPYKISLVPYSKVAAFSFNSHRRAVRLSPEEIRPGVDLFEKLLSVGVGENSQSRTHYPNNTMGVIRFTDLEKMAGEVWQVAVVSQNGLFFFVEEKLIDFKFEQKSGGLISKELQDWTSFSGWHGHAQIALDLFRELGGKWTSKKTKKHLIGEVVPGGFAGTDTHQGIVVSWDSAQGNGIIATAHGNALVTWKDLFRRYEGCWQEDDLDEGGGISRAFLKKGDAVRCTLTRYKDTPYFSLKATNISNLCDVD